MNYTTLIAAKTTSGSIKNFLNRSDIPVDVILTETEAWLYERLRVREMQAQEEFQFDAAASSEALPDGFLDPLHFWPYTWGEPLEYRSLERFLAPRDEDGDLYEGTPARWTVMADVAQVDVTCAENFAGLLTYYDTPAALSSLNTTNFLTRRYPRLLRVALMAVGLEHMKDADRAVGYFSGAEALVNEANASNEMYRRGQYA